MPPKKKTTTTKAKTTKTTKKTTKKKVEEDPTSEDEKVSTKDVSSDEDIEEVEYEKGDGDRPLEQIYEKKTPKEHILLRPDSYIGSIVKTEAQMWVYDEDLKAMKEKKITYVPGLYKIFDEILVNAADNRIRDETMTKIKVTIDQKENSISVWNNGKGIPVAIHKKEGVYIPTMIFGELLTGSNFNDDKKKVTGGRNGYGAKLTNIFSTEFTVETLDAENKKKFKQTWKNNMSDLSEPKITSSVASESYTQVTFKPDLERFKMDELDDDTVALLKRRVIDIAGTTAANVSVHLNGKKIPVKNFKDYIQLYKTEKKELIYSEVNDRWQVGVALSDGSHQQVSFVNSVWTMAGGKHVNYVLKQLTKKIQEKVAKKNKSVPIKPQHVKNHIFLFINSLIINPSFGSQTKETLTTNVADFGSKCKLEEEFLDKVVKSPIIAKILEYAKGKEGDELKKKSGSKRAKLTGIAKLDDANDAGSRYSDQCTLIVTEGDSAKSLAISGLSVIGRDRYGVFPLKGKVLNVRDAKLSAITKNEEISTITKIFGLKFGTTYTKEDLKQLRYGSLMIMADQDHDGSHIKGLLLNYIHKFWPSLLTIPGFIKEFITPIVKVVHKRTKKETAFFTIPEYQKWTQTANTKQYTIKYYKGLGTSTSQEAKEYFSNLKKHQVQFQWDDSDDKFDLLFKKGREDDRKDWMNTFEDGSFLDHSKGKISYKDFFDKEYIQFALDTTGRSIPNIMDGLKPGQRKILFSCFKRNLKKEIKVAQLSGYVAEHSAYHHGEQSLADTIVRMAQNFVGSNNINLLVPSGQFGTRIHGGDDSASPRYIFTRLAEITRYIYIPEDDNILEYLEDDGQSIEPKYYAPILPMILVNGAAGMGFGWASNIPMYSPFDIVENLKKMLNGEEPEELVPYAKGFQGTIEYDENPTPKKARRYVTRGILEKIDDTTVKITELPLYVWTQKFKEYLVTLIPGEKSKEGSITDFKENHTDTTVSFTIFFTPEQMKAAEETGLEKFFKLHSYLNLTAFVAFKENGKIAKFDSTNQIIKEFYETRLELYQKRKDHVIGRLQREFDILDNKVRFILAVVNEEIIIRKRKKTELLKELVQKKFTPFPKEKLQTKKTTTEEESDEEANENESQEVDEDDISNGFNYLLSMPLWSLTIEKVKELEKQKASKLEQLEQTKATTIQEMWRTDLDAFVEKLTEVEGKEEAERAKDAKSKRATTSSSSRGRGRARGGKTRATGTKRKKAASDDEKGSDSEKEAESTPKAKKKGKKASKDDSDEEVVEKKEEKKEDKKQSLLDRIRAKKKEDPEKPKEEEKKKEKEDKEEKAKEAEKPDEERKSTTQVRSRRQPAKKQKIDTKGNALITSFFQKVTKPKEETEEVEEKEEEKREEKEEKEKEPVSKKEPEKKPAEDDDEIMLLTDNDEETQATPVKKTRTRARVSTKKKKEESDDEIDLLSEDDNTSRKGDDDDDDEDVALTDVSTLTDDTVVPSDDDDDDDYVE